ncbi:MAG: HAD family phosphatase [Bacteroidales bacterium]|nr:MAG: HAD family phosphatase [Bacteroidales bacterium]
MKKTNLFQAAVFDMDGVIVDNHTYHVKAWAEFCHNYSIPFDEIKFRAKFFGKNNHDIFHGLMDGKLTAKQIDTLGEEKEQIYRELYKNDIMPVNGLIPFLNTLKDAGIKTAVATSAPTSNLDFTLDNLKIRHLFDVVIDASGITKGKPDPEIYLKASKILDIPPSHCIVFEDSISGIESGQNAGMRVVALVTTHQPYELPKTHLQVNDFTELSIELLIS